MIGMYQFVNGIFLQLITQTEVFSIIGLTKYKATPQSNDPVNQPPNHFFFTSIQSFHWAVERRENPFVNNGVISDF